MAPVPIVDEDPQIRSFPGVSLGTCGHLEPGFSDMTGQEVIGVIRRSSMVPTSPAGSDRK